MGMYTELIFGAKLKIDTPDDVINTLKHMLGKDDIPIGFNPIIDFGRNPLIGSSYYFGISTPAYRMIKDDIDNQWEISTRSNIKNYDHEIESFLE